MAEIIISSIFLIIIIFVFLRLIFTALSQVKKDTILIKIAKVFSKKTDFLFSYLDKKLNITIGYIRLNYLILILLLMLLEKLILLFLKNN